MLTTLFLFRHGQTEWSVSGQHTGKTDIPLTDKGREQALTLRPIAEHIAFSKVLVSPLARARQTAEIAGLGSKATVCPDLIEVDYGDYEGLTTSEIRKRVSDWTVWTHPCPGGETLEQAGARTARVIEEAQKSGDNVAVFAHGHILRILTATWLQMPPSEGKHFILDTSTVSVLGHERETPAIKIWNSPANLVASLVEKVAHH